MAGWEVAKTHSLVASRMKQMACCEDQVREEMTRSHHQSCPQLDHRDEVRIEDEVYLMMYLQEVDHRRLRKGHRKHGFRIGQMASLLANVQIFDVK